MNQRQHKPEDGARDGIKPWGAAERNGVMVGYYLQQARSDHKFFSAPQVPSLKGREKIDQDTAAEFLNLFVILGTL